MWYLLLRRKYCGRMQRRGRRIAWLRRQGRTNVGDVITCGWPAVISSWDYAWWCPVVVAVRPSLQTVVSRCGLALCRGRISSVADGAVEELFVRQQPCPSYSRKQQQQQLLQQRAAQQQSAAASRQPAQPRPRGRARISAPSGTGGPPSPGPTSAY